jgi:hypothetical protein
MLVQFRFVQTGSPFVYCAVVLVRLMSVNVIDSFGGLAVFQVGSFKLDTSQQFRIFCYDKGSPGLAASIVTLQKGPMPNNSGQCLENNRGRIVGGIARTGQMHLERRLWAGERGQWG